MAVVEPVGADVATHVDLVDFEGMLHTQARHHYQFSLASDFGRQTVLQVKEDAVHGLALLDFHHRHGPAVIDGKAQWPFFGKQSAAQGQ